MNRGRFHLTRFRLRWRESKPPSPPQGGGEGPSGEERFMGSPPFLFDLLTRHEPAHCSTSPAPGGSIDRSPNLRVACLLVEPPVHGKNGFIPGGPRPDRG